MKLCTEASAAVASIHLSKVAMFTLVDHIWFGGGDDHEKGFDVA